MNECMLDRQTAGCVVEKIVLPQIVSIKQASEIMKLPPYYLRRVCRENPDIAFPVSYTHLTLPTIEPV